MPDQVHISQIIIKLSRCISADNKMSSERNEIIAEASTNFTKYNSFKNNLVGSSK